MLTSLLFLSVHAAQAWYYSDGAGREWKGEGAKPTIICHVDICDSLWGMGVREEQMLGYFGADVSSWNSLCHGTNCMSAHFEQMTFVGDGTYYGIDMDKVSAINPGIIVDAAYCHQERIPGQCFTNATYVGLLQYASEQVEALLAGPWAMINIDVAGRGYLEVVDALQRLAIAIGDPPNQDTIEHCHTFHDAMTAVSSRARVMWAEGIRVLTLSIGRGAETIYAAQPTDDPILIMLQELGVMMVHVNVNDPRRGYWEYMPFNSSAPQGEQVTLANGDVGLYPADVILYDARSHQSVAEDFALDPVAQFNHPGWVQGQIAPWPIDSTWTYERGTRILNQILDVFNSAERVLPRTNCVLHDVSTNERLPPGGFACYDPKPNLPACPDRLAVYDPPSPPPPPTPSPANDESMSDGAIAGLSVGLFIGGVIIGIIVTKAVSAKAKPAVTKSTTHGIEVKASTAIESA